MATIVSIHSFRGGTGKSNTTANAAAILAQRGRRVGVIDADTQSPGIHVLFGLAKSNSATFEAVTLAQLARQLELAGLPTGTMPLDRLDAACEQVSSALRKLADG